MAATVQDEDIIAVITNSENDLPLIDLGNRIVVEEINGDQLDRGIRESLFQPEDQHHNIDENPEDRQANNISEDEIKSFFETILDDDVSGFMDHLQRNNGLIHIKKDSFEHTVLHVAAISESLNIMKYILINGLLKINVRDKHSATPLHAAAERNKTNSIELLIKHGANINAKQMAGFTPLHSAALSAAPEAVEFLIGAKAKLNILNRDNNTAYKVAAQQIAFYSGDAFYQQRIDNLRRIMFLLDQNKLTSEGGNDIKPNPRLDPKLAIIAWKNLQEIVEIGKGAQAIVSKGIWDLSRKEVAIKRLSSSISFSDNFSDEAFHKEAMIMSSLSHPNIVTVYGIVLEPFKCIVMEYLPRGTLYHFLSVNNSIDIPQCYQISLDIANGLAYLHKAENRIVHRDLKSANILLDEKEGNLTAKLADFGFATVIPLSPSNSHMNVSNKGTEAWMAPEVRKNSSSSSYTEKSDIYSCGVVFWEILTKKRPYSVGCRITESSTSGENREIYCDEPMEASHMLKHIPNDAKSHILPKLVEECLENDPSIRPEIKDVCKRLTSFFAPPKISISAEEPSSPSYSFRNSDSIL